MGRLLRSATKLHGAGLDIDKRECTTSDPDLAAWLKVALGPAGSELVADKPLTALLFASGKSAVVSGGIDTPTGVVTGWSRLLLEAKREAAQSEAALINLAMTLGWPDSQILMLIGVDEESDLRTHLRDLEEHLRRTHPGYQADEQRDHAGDVTST